MRAEVAGAVGHGGPPAAKVLSCPCGHLAGESLVRAQHGPVVQLGVHAGLSSRRSRVQIPSGPPAASTRSAERGRIAQLVERAPEKREVTGSTPVPTTERNRRSYAISASRRRVPKVPEAAVVPQACHSGRETVARRAGPKARVSHRRSRGAWCRYGQTQRRDGATQVSLRSSQLASTGETTGEPSAFNRTVNPPANPALRNR